MSLSDHKVDPVMATADLDKARDFYENKLGLAVESDHTADGGPVTYRAGEGSVVAVYLSPEHAGKSTATMAGWIVDDLEPLVDALTESGVVFEQYDEEDMKTNGKGIIEFEGGGVAFFRDPDGNTHALNQG
jgi:catechol 2,3-dioxygenase-like lactoylglutathione lyase family enzyme